MVILKVMLVLALILLIAGVAFALFVLGLNLLIDALGIDVDELRSKKRGGKGDGAD